MVHAKTAVADGRWLGSVPQTLTFPAGSAIGMDVVIEDEDLARK